MGNTKDPNNEVQEMSKLPGTNHKMQEATDMPTGEQNTAMNLKTPSSTIIPKPLIQHLQDVLEVKEVKYSYQSQVQNRKQLPNQASFINTKKGNTQFNCCQQ